VPLGRKQRLAYAAVSARQRVYIRSALASRKQPLLRAFSSEKGGSHTRLAGGLCFDIWFLGAFFASQKTGLSAPIPRTAAAVLRDFHFNPFRGQLTRDLFNNSVSCLPTKEKACKSRKMQGILQFLSGNLS
jgi:hypothetical protein